MIEYIKIIISEPNYYAKNIWNKRIKYKWENNSTRLNDLGREYEENKYKYKYKHINIISSHEITFYGRLPSAIILQNVIAILQ